MNQKIAIPDPSYPSIVTMGDGKRMSREDAKAKGYAIYGEIADVQSDLNAKISADERAWRSAIMLLPDARDRPAATAELLTSQTSDTLPLAAARAFLRGLPTEHTERTQNVVTPHDPSAARRVEIQASMAGFNRSMGYTGKRAPIAAGPSAAASINDPVKLKRLAEIRLTALAMRDDAQASNDSRKLKCALDSHNATGASLATFMAQLGVDTKFLNCS